MVDNLVSMLYRFSWLSGHLRLFQLQLQGYKFTTTMYSASNSWLLLQHLSTTNAANTSPVVTNKGATNSQKPLPAGPCTVAYFDGHCTDLIAVTGYTLYDNSESLSVAYCSSSPQWSTNNQAECAACLFLLYRLVTEPTLVKGLSFVLIRGDS